ncbi:PLP-dependent aminotransferase family protein [Nonomuraea aridisoli]|uniref:PLP-dependent aminotransferase family protein n=1 Tax=Nonomuraea aridisoli TaxID=2070368 RepID=A0A2W2CX15_9ACTN|nr:PLP-dependent aminotransferase family protein [Nonomuraea aridisoli]PZG03043.1 PLP-dependent aminotransferase family protein [Nonomuraea aridisoli]
MSADPSLFADLLDEDGQTGPVYQRIAEAIATAVTTGRLLAGERLPTHRELARELRVAVPTVSRAYREAEQQGLISSTVGRGTFVSGVSGIPHLRGTPAPGQPADTGRLDMAVNAPARGMHEELLRMALTAVSTSADAGTLLGYEADIGSYDHRSSACRWLAHGGLDVEPRQVAICHGGQHALLVALTASLRAGETLLTEALTYPGVKSAAQLLGIGLSAVAMDAQGLIPEALEEACVSSTAPRALYCMPTAHNPTAVTLSPQRRQAIVDIARRHDLMIIEDDVFGLLAQDAVTPLAALAPERTLYLTSLSKTIAPGLRCGFLAGPPQLTDRLGALVRATVFNPSPLSTAVAMRWLDDGTADRLLDWQCGEMARRRTAAEHLLGAHPAISHVRSAALHAWVEMREPWTASEVVSLADGLGMTISPTMYFLAGNQTLPRGVRLCLGNAADVGTLTTALRTLTEGMERGRPTWASGTQV